MFKNQMIKKHSILFLLGCLLLGPATPLLAQTPTEAETQIPLEFKEIRTSEKLSSPRRGDFEHLANYWLENYAQHRLNQTLAEQLAAKTQTLLLPAMISGTKETVATPHKRVALLKDLQIINSLDKKSVLTGIDRTITQAGKTSLFTMLATENTNWAAIKERQKFIRFLIDTPHLLKEIQDHLRSIKTYENRSLEALFRAEEMRAQREERRAITLKSGVFGWIALGIRSFLENTFYKVDSLNTLFTTIGTTVIVCAIPFFGILSLGCVTALGLGYFYAATKAEILGDALFKVTTLKVHWLVKVMPLIVLGHMTFPTWMLIIYAGIYGYQAYSFFSKARARSTLFHDRFMAVQSAAQSYQSTLKILTTLNSHEETKELFADFMKDASSDWQRLAGKLATNSFAADKTPSLFATHHGRVENALELLLSTRDEFGQVSRFYGEIDAYASMAQFYLDRQNTTNSLGENIHCCQAEFIDESTESIVETQNFWHPIIPIDRVRPSTLALGGPHNTARNLVVTGPNAGGKSVNLKALIINILLAQTFGFACAEKFRLTPFTKVIARFKSVDDTEGDKSKFMLEAIEMAALLKEMTSLKPTEHAFVETDELFTGTEVGPAISLSIELCARIAKMKNVMYVLATHYKQLTDLRIVTGGVFDNYKVSVFKEPNTNKLVYPYALSRGIGNTNVAFDIFLEQLEAQKINDATLVEVITKAKARQEAIEGSL